MSYVAEGESLHEETTGVEELGYGLEYVGTVVAALGLARGLTGSRAKHSLICTDMVEVEAGVLQLDSERESEK